jgi:hypothetical protein
MKKFIEKYSKKPDNLFKLIFVNFLFAYSPFSILYAFLSLFGTIPVNFNGEEVYGIKGFLVMILFTPFLVLMFTIVVWIYFMIGNLFLKLLKRLFV